MGLYIYVVAAAIAVFGIIFFFKTNIEKIKEDPKQAPNAQKNFFIGAAISETLPIILLILGLVNQEPVQIEEIYFPAILIVMLMAFAMFFILLQRSVGSHKDSKAIVNNFSFIAIAMVNAIPIVALVFLFLSIQ